jgi:hypothetical protein
MSVSKIANKFEKSLKLSLSHNKDNYIKISKAMHLLSNAAELFDDAALSNHAESITSFLEKLAATIEFPGDETQNFESTLPTNIFDPNQENVISLTSLSKPIDEPTISFNQIAKTITQTPLSSEERKRLINILLNK